MYGSGGCLLAEGSDDQFADLAWCDGFERLGIDNLRQEEVFPDVCAVLILALSAYARTAHLGEAVDVDGLDVEFGFQFTTYAPRPRFCSEEADTQLELRDIYFVLLDYLCQMQGVGRRAADGRRAHVLHHHDLLLGVACRCWQLHGTKLGSTVVGT